MKKVLKIIGLVLVGIVLGFGLKYIPADIDESVKVKTLVRFYEKIEAEVDYFTLTSKEGQLKFSRFLLGKLIFDGKVKVSPFGVIPVKTFANTENLRSTEISILVDSSGGSVDLLNNIIKDVQGFRQFNLKITCYISQAQSAAFTLVQSICDWRYLLSGAKLMQHKAYFSGGLFPAKYYNSSTTITSLRMNKIEAVRIGMKEKDWYKISRENGDRFFTEREALGLDLVDAVLE